MSSTVTKEDVEAFGNQCALMRSVYQSHRLLFESGDGVRNLLAETASVFFGDLNRMMLEYNFLQICKITDREEMHGNENLTTEYFMNAGDAYPELDRLKVVGQGLKKFREKLQPARHKLIAHLDRNAVHSGNALGAASQEEWNQFWLDLQEFVNILYDHYLSDPHMHINGIVNTSGADSVIMALKKAADMEKLLHDKEVAKKWADLKTAEWIAEQKEAR